LQPHTFFAVAAAHRCGILLAKPLGGGAHSVNSRGSCSPPCPPWPTHPVSRPALPAALVNKKYRPQPGAQGQRSSELNSRSSVAKHTPAQCLTNPAAKAWLEENSASGSWRCRVDRRAGEWHWPPSMPVQAWVLPPRPTRGASASEGVQLQSCCHARTLTEWAEGGAGVCGGC